MDIQHSKPFSNPTQSNASSFISNNFTFTLHLKDLLEMLVSAQQALRTMNQKIENTYPKSSLSTLILSMDQFLDSLWFNKNRQVNRILLYSVYGWQQLFPIKTGMSKRNEMISHLNIMTMGLSQKIKESVVDDGLYYSNEDDLFNAMLKVFRTKLFESPVFRKVFY